MKHNTNLELTHRLCDGQSCQILGRIWPNYHQIEQIYDFLNDQFTVNLSTDLLKTPGVSFLVPPIWPNFPPNLTEFSPKSDRISPKSDRNFPPNLTEFPPNLAPVAADDSFVLMLDEGSGLRIVSWAIFVLIITPARVSTKTYWFGLKYLRVRKNLGMLFSDTSTHLTHFTWRMRKLYRGWGRIVRLFWGGIILVGKTKRGKEGGGEKTKRKQGSCFE